MPQLPGRHSLNLMLVLLLSSTGMVVAFGQNPTDRSSQQTAVTQPEQSERVANSNSTSDFPVPTATQIPAPEPNRTPIAVNPPLLQGGHPDYIGGWRQAGNGADGLHAMERRHILYVTPEGLARGQITLIDPATGELVPATDVKLTFLNADGETFLDAVVGDDGVFQLTGVPEGVFAVVASGPSAFMAFGVHTVPTEDVHEMVEWAFVGAAVPAQDFPAVAAILSDFEGAKPRPIVEPPEHLIPEEARKRGGWIAGEGVVANLLATPIQHHQAFRQPDGRVLGRLRNLHPVSGRPLNARNLRVHVVRNAEIVASTTTGALGTFEFDNLVPGVYSLIAEGADGFLAIAMDVVEPQQQAAARDESVQFVALQAPPLEIDGATVPANLVNQVQQLFEQGQQGVGVGGGGGFATGSGSGSTGGGGFGGGSGGLLEALAAAGVAAAAAAAADENNDNPQPASPDMPDESVVIPPVF